MKRLLAALVLLSACKSETAAAPSPAQQPQAAAQTPPRTDSWQQVVGAPDRSETDRKLDPGRHPAQMLEFLGVKPGMKVVDIGAGGGYTTELLARAVGPSGTVYMQNDPRWLSFLKDALGERFTHPAMKGVVRADVPFDDPIPPEAKDLDLVVMNVIYHDIANMPVDRVRMNKVVFNALKPGGAYVVIDSSAKDGSGLTETRTLHRIDEKVVKDEVQQAGFKLAAEGSFLRNPDDARDWNSSPQAAQQAGKRGQSDRFALKFVRPDGSQSQLIPPHLRLPPGARPVRMSAELAVDPSQDEFHGTGELELSLDAATPILWLNAYELKVLDTEPKSTPLEGGRGFVGLQFAQPLPAGKATLKMHWQGRLSRTDLEGLFREQENGEWYVLSQGEPLGMRRVLPCFDEPAFKIPWKISLRVPKTAAAFFNTPIESSREEGDSKVVRFAETPPLPSYLLAFGVGPFERVDGGKLRSGQPVGIVVTKGKAAWAKYSARSSAPLTELLAAYFRVPYHYPKLDLIEVPLGGGAMENPGLITFAQRINLARPGADSPQFQIRAAAVEAHEFAHLWFGDMVTMAWWDDLWLNEAFANWMGSKTMEAFHPAWGEPSERVREANHAMSEDRLLTARRIRQPIEGEGDIATAFDSITYEKGAAVIRMFELWVGAEKFRSGVTRYLQEHADGNATAKDFLAAISTEAGRDVAPAFSTFLDQGGVPMVTAKLVCEGGKGRLELAQSRYVPLGVKAPREQFWQIPVCARTDKGRACTLLAEKSGTLDLGACPAWVMPNADAAGYYRSALDQTALGRLTANTRKLSAPERLGAFLDLAAAARAGVVEEAQVLELSQALAGDKDRHVLQAILPVVSYLRDAGIVSGDLTGKYEAFVREEFGKRAHALGFAEKKGEAEDARILRPLLVKLVGDNGADPQLRADAQKLASRWLGDHRVASPELASAALQLSAIAGGRAVYDRLHQAAKEEKDRVERIRILEAMGRARDPGLVQEGFRIFLSDEFDPRESSTLIWGPAGHPQTREAALAFVEKSFDEIVRRMPRGSIGDYGAQLPRIASDFCDEAHAAEAEKVFRPLMRQHVGGDRRLSQAVEEARQCAAFREKATPSVTAFLQRAVASR